MGDARVVDHRAGGTHPGGRPLPPPELREAVLLRRDPPEKHAPFDIAHPLHLPARACRNHPGSRRPQPA